MVDTIFRQYDIRGKVPAELVPEKVYELGLAISSYFIKRNGQVRTIVLGADGRTHSPFIRQELTRALLDSGLNVIDIGTCPTPLMYFGVHTLSVEGGLMVTASHNTKEYNGIKMCLGKDSVWGNEIQEIKRMYLAKEFLKVDQAGLVKVYDLMADYTAWLKQEFKDLVGCELSMIFDCAHGAAGTIMPRLIKEMKWGNAQLLYEEINGEFPAHEADPVVDENASDLKKAVLHKGASVGIGFDGDCDRMAPVTSQGKLIIGDKLLALFAQDILRSRPEGKVVFDIKCSSGLADAIVKSGGIPCLSPTGHSIIKNRMKLEQALIGGELSCHFFFADRYFGYDDGIYAALRLIELLKKSNTSLDVLISTFPQKFSTPEIRIECSQSLLNIILQSIKDVFSAQSDVEILTVDGVRVSTSYGWGLARASNTQPAICLRFEANSLKELEHIQQDFFHVLAQHFDNTQLKKDLYGS